MTAPVTCVCGRPLRDPTSIARRLGPICARRLNSTTPAIRTPTADPPHCDGQTALDLQPHQPTLWSI